MTSPTGEQARGTVPGYIELAGAAVAVFLWERALDIPDQPIWQQGLAYFGEVLFGMVVADLLWGGARLLARKRTVVDPTTMAAYGVGVLFWLACAAWAAWRDVSLDGSIAVGAAFLIMAVGLSTCRRLTSRR